MFTPSYKGKYIFGQELQNILSFAPEQILNSIHVILGRDFNEKKKTRIIIKCQPRESMLHVSVNKFSVI